MHAQAEAPRVDPGGDIGCTECGRAIGDQGRWHSGSSGSLLPYCRSCAELELPVLLENEPGWLGRGR
jgi:hypothetical protein